MQKVSGKKFNTKTALIITTIASPNRCMQLFAKECNKHGIDFIIIGDKKSPVDFTLEGADYFSIERQKKLPFSLAGRAPFNHYSRKNMGYLAAIAGGAEVIMETDDDNFPYPGFWNYQPTSRIKSGLITGTGWINIYRFFTGRKIWARGFPLELAESEQALFPSLKSKSVPAPIQQGLADLDADVDALFRMTEKRKIKFNTGINVALGNNAWSPFNSQNTRWYKEAFCLLYLPATCSARLTDIWRSFIAQRICFENNWHILFQSPTVCHKRNHHNLLKDFEEEYAGYLNNNNIKEGLEKLKLRNGEQNIPSNLLRCYEWFVKQKLLKQKELDLLDRWLADYKNFRR